MRAFLAVPHVRQKFDFTCGPASLRMVLLYYGISLGPVKAWWKTRAHRLRGTTRQNLVHAIRSFGLHVHAHSNASVVEIRSFIEQGVPVIVNYREPLYDDGHYAVVIGVTKTSIILQDPYHGSRFSLKLSVFRSRWRGSSPRHPRWLLAATNKHVPLPHSCTH